MKALDPVMMSMDQYVNGSVCECSEKGNVQYDTTFNLCDYYLSVLSFSHPFIVNDKKKFPPIPLIYYFHSRKFTETHETFWHFFKQTVKRSAIKKLRSAIKKCLMQEYNVCLVRCWNHLSIIGL